MRHIEDDSVATLSTTKLYGKNGPMVEDLRELLAAWYVSRVDEGMGYVSQRCGQVRYGRPWSLMLQTRLIATGPRGTPPSGHAIDEHEHRRGLHLPP
jgi:hypothetical protein